MLRSMRSQGVRRDLATEQQAEPKGLSFPRFDFKVSTHFRLSFLAPYPSSPPRACSAESHFVFAHRLTLNALPGSLDCVVCHAIPLLARRGRCFCVPSHPGQLDFHPCPSRLHPRCRAPALPHPTSCCVTSREAQL